MVHLKTVIERVAEVGLKLKPSKCHFAKRELEYLGHMVSRDGLKTSPCLVEAVRNFLVPQSVHDLCRFLGLSLYYRKFIPQFCKGSSPTASAYPQGCSGYMVTRLPDCVSGAEGETDHSASASLPKLQV